MTPMEDVMSALGVLGMCIVGLFVLFVAILGFLMPIYIMSMNSKVRRMNEQLDTLIKVSGGNSVTKSTNELLAEVRTQNELQRQLLRAQGHEPEV